MHRDPDLLFALLALEQQLVTREQFLDAVELHAMDRSRNLRTLILGFGALSKDDESALESQVRDRLDKTDTAATLKPGRGSDGDMSDDIAGLLDGLEKGAPGDEVEDDISLSRSEEERKVSTQRERLVKTVERLGTERQVALCLDECGATKVVVVGVALEA